MRTIGQRIERALELVREAEANVVIVGLGHAQVALEAAIDADTVDACIDAAESADRRIAALFQRGCGVPCEHARRCLREARQVLTLPVTEVAV